uniref:RNA polymerase beta subunit n=1 Tax=Tetraselmis marina TaxID=41888 RepID=UPI0021ACF582|nr:RNA polymerase beta subunit [Tetraselmis marina]UUA64518.1 RNA polymerase beta subunit [Tetraselmis marina]
MTNTKTNIAFFDHCFDKNRLKKWINKIYLDTTFTDDLTLLNFIEKLKNLGFEQATRAGVSIGIDDLKIPPKKNQLLKSIEYNIEETTREFGMNRITALENFQNFIDIWHRTSETLKNEVVFNFEATDTLNPVYMMAFSGARGNLSQVSQLVGMRGFMSDPEGQIIDYPIRSNFREGLTLTEYVISCYGARKGLVDTALRTADAGYLTRRLVDVAHHVIITKFDCKAQQGIWLTSINDNDKVLYSLEKRLVGRVLASDVYFPYFDEETDEQKRLFWSYFSKNQQLDPTRAKLLATFFKKVRVRSPLRCLKRKRLCQLCYGWTLPHGQLAPIGEAVGILAAQSIGEPGTQLTMRTFHTGGVFSGALSDEIRAPHSGFIEYDTSLKGAMFRSVSGNVAFLTKEPGCLRIKPTISFECQSSVSFELQFPKFSTLFFRNGQKICSNDLLIEFPKQDESDKETVFNTYTYYSKSSGILEVSKTLSKSDKNDEIINHPKLPKLHPFFEQQKYKNKKFQIFQISSGQLYQINNANQLLAKPGDLVNTNTLLNLTQLINPDTGIEIQFDISQKQSYLTQPQQLTQIFAKKLIYNVSLESVFYNSQVGYTYSTGLNRLSSLNRQLTTIIPCLNQQIKLPVLQKTINLSSIPLFKTGKLFSPLFELETEISEIYNCREKSILHNQYNYFLSANYISNFGLRIDKTQLDLKNALTNFCFYVSEPQYFTSNVFSKKFIDKGRLPKLKLKKIGITLSNYKTKHRFVQNNELSSVQINWISKKKVLTQKTNLQNHQEPILAKTDGFLFTKSLMTQKSLPLKKVFNRVFSTNYWERSSMQTLKIGWAYLSLHKNQRFSLHQKFFLFGEHIIDSISFSKNSIYTEWIHFKFATTYGLDCFRDRLILRSKKQVSSSFVVIPSTYFLLLLASASEHPQFDSNLISSFKFSKFVLTQNKQLLTYKYLLFINTFITKVKKEFQNLFLNLNKCSKTSTRIFELIHTITRFELHICQNPHYQNKLNQFKSSTNPLKLNQSHPIKPIQVILKTNTHQQFNFLSGSFNKQNLFESYYSYSLTRNLIKQTYFKNFILHGLNTNLITNKLQIDGNSPILQSSFISPFLGELSNIQSKTLTNKFTQNALIITNKDTFTLKTPVTTSFFKIGDNIFYGQQMSVNNVIPYSGKVIQIGLDYVKLQFIETSLVSPNSYFLAENQQLISKTARLFTQPYPRLQMGDIVQGIPKIEEFFEARQTKEGEIFEGNLHARLKKRFLYYRRKCKYPRFIATRKSTLEIQNYIIESIFKLYNSQGINISDKHLEIIVRQMTSRVMVTEFWLRRMPSLIPWKHPLPHELYLQRSMEKFLAKRKNTERDHIRYEPVVLGITKAALGTGGFISSASFQETTRILSKGAVFQKRDHLKGLKENVILGHIIPAGTAVRMYSRRRKGPVMAHKFTEQALQVLTVNYDWQLNVVNKKTPNTQYFNPVRLVLIEMLFLTYFHAL